MPNGKPNPKCKDCKGSGQITLFVSSCECECVNSKSNFVGVIDAIKNFNDALHNNPYHDEDFEIRAIPPPKTKPLYKIDIDPKTLDTIKKLQLSADYIANGILTWFMWPGIEGHTCNRCGATMNVLGMSYNHWCPLCDPDGKEYVFHSMSHQW